MTPTKSRGAQAAPRGSWSSWLQPRENVAQRAERIAQLVSDAGQMDVVARFDALGELVELVLSTEPRERELSRTAFLENECWAAILELAVQPAGDAKQQALRVKALQTAAMLLWNIHDPLLLAYLLAHDALRQVVLAAPLFQETEATHSATGKEADVDSDLLPSYLSLLRTVCLRLDIASLPLVFREEDNTFPLLNAATQFLDNDDRLVRAAAYGMILGLVRLSADAPTLDRFLSREMEQKNSFSRRYIANLGQAAIAAVSVNGDQARAAAELQDVYEFLGELANQAGPFVQLTLLNLLRSDFLTPVLVAAANGDRSDLTLSDAVQLFIFFLERGHSALVCSECCATLVRSERYTALLSRFVKASASNADRIADHDRLRCLTAYAASVPVCIAAREALINRLEAVPQGELWIQLDPGRSFWGSVFDEKTNGAGGIATTLEMVLLRLVLAVDDPEQHTQIDASIVQLYRERIGDIQLSLEQNPAYANDLGRLLAHAEDRQRLCNDLLQHIRDRYRSRFGSVTPSEANTLNENALDSVQRREHVIADASLWLLAHAVAAQAPRRQTGTPSRPADSSETSAAYKRVTCFLGYLEATLDSDTYSDVDAVLLPLYKCDLARSDPSRWSTQSAETMTLALAQTDVFNCSLEGRRVLCAADENESKMLIVGEVLEGGGFQPLLGLPLEYILELTEPEPTTSATNEGWCVLIQRSDVTQVLDLVFESESTARDFVAHVSKLFPQVAAWRAACLRDALLLPHSRTSL